MKFSPGDLVRVTKIDTTGTQNKDEERNLLKAYSKFIDQILEVTEVSPDGEAVYCDDLLFFDRELELVFTV